ncbi:hypothetical protein SAMN02743940_0052 [Nitrosomonas cryotolerans ATCC 49181]|uniref:Uncharacterized protein n=1 Tax=Nitrosomonas cryotolerans ATCC 49181 TaxID=1131553 RepID=A0A1N6JYS9_9PROT|nr:hypothetical protein SAMN02743940_0052 [Nitrosomonas cryotolerans ATCC 49181]
MLRSSYNGSPRSCIIYQHHVFEKKAGYHRKIGKMEKHSLYSFTAETQGTADKLLFLR